jgi:hypothetical protein
MWMEVGGGPLGMEDPMVACHTGVSESESVVPGKETEPVKRQSPSSVKNNMRTRTEDMDRDIRLENVARDMVSKGHWT